MGKTGNRFIIFSGLALLLILVLENINGRFWLNDFRVYYGAAKAFVNGDRVYGVVFGEDTGLYKYSPFLLFLFSPASFLSFEMASLIHFFVESFAVVGMIFLSGNIISQRFGFKSTNTSLVYSLVFIGLLNHIFRELHLGNVNLILVLLLMCSVWLIARQKEASAGLIFGLCLLFKPYFLLLLLPLMYFRKLKTLTYTVLSVVAMVVVCIVLMGFSDAIWMHQEWIKSMVNHSDLLVSYHTISAIIQSFTGIRTGPWAALFVLIGLLLLLKSITKETKDNQQSFLMSWMVLLAIIPSLVITDTEHFLFAAPLIIFLTMSLFQQKNLTLSLFFVAALLMYGANSPEFFGSDLSDKIDHWGFLGISNLLLVFFALFVFRTNERRGAYIK